MISETGNSTFKKSSTVFEVLIQIGIMAIFFLGTSFRRDSDHIHWGRLIFLGNYFVAAMVVNYFLMPKFYYHKKYFWFIIGAILVIILSILLEELVLEQILARHTRGSRFSSIFFTFVRMLPFVMLFVGFKFAWDGQRRQRELDALKNVMSESQLQFLKSQINPHFLFNSLNNLYSYALEKSEKTPEIILELSSLLRYMLYETKETKVPLDKEVKYLEDFIRLQSLQIEDRGNVRFNKEGDFHGKYIAPLILIVFVENCFKHSTSSLSHQIDIEIDLQMRGNVLHFKTANSYSEMKNTESLNEGIGLQNVKTRLELLYPNVHRLDIHKENNVYKVDLEITLD